VSSSGESGRRDFDDNELDRAKRTFLRRMFRVSLAGEPHFAAIMVILE
jgi:hypothetical protein